MESFGTNRKRKKRQDYWKVDKKECPTDFQKVSDQLCLHYYNKDRTFHDSQEYCKSKANGAKIFSFHNSTEALLVWKWLGKHE